MGNNKIIWPNMEKLSDHNRYVKWARPPLNDADVKVIELFKEAAKMISEGKTSYVKRVKIETNYIQVNEKWEYFQDEYYSNGRKKND